MSKSKYLQAGLAVPIVVCLVTLVGAVALVTNQVASQDKEAVAGGQGQPSAEEMAQMQKMMEVWEKMGTPGEGHKRLDHFVGKWDLVVRMWMGGPGTPPTETKGVSDVRSIFGGRYFLEELTSEMELPGKDGKPETKEFKGMGLTGYDNFKKMYVGSWVDNMSTMIFSQKGSCDPTGKVFTYYGEMDEPGLGVQDRMAKSVIRIVDKDKHVFEMYDLHVADDYKVMEITYTRKK